MNNVTPFQPSAQPPPAPDLKAAIEEQQNRVYRVVALLKVLGCYMCGQLDTEDPTTDLPAALALRSAFRRCSGSQMAACERSSASIRALRSCKSTRSAMLSVITSRPRPGVAGLEITAVERHGVRQQAVTAEPKPVGGKAKRTGPPSGA